MPDGKPGSLNPSSQHNFTPSACEGNAERGSPQEGLISDEMQPAVVQLTNAELVQLRIRVIALENLVITLLADTSDRQRTLAREMANYISPRPGFTEHPLTIHAAAQMIHLVERADHFRDVPSP